MIGKKQGGTQDFGYQSNGISFVKSEAPTIQPFKVDQQFTVTF